MNPTIRPRGEVELTYLGKPRDYVRHVAGGAACGKSQHLDHNRTPVSSSISTTTAYYRNIKETKEIKEEEDRTRAAQPGFRGG